MASILEGMGEEAIRSYAELAVRLERNPKTRVQAMRLVKELDPTRPLPELESLEREEKLRAEMAEKIGEERKEREQQNYAHQRELMIRDMVASGAVADRAEFEKVEKAGIEAGISRFDTALSHYRSSQEQAQTSANPLADYGSPTKPVLEGLKEFNGNVAQWAESQAHQAVNEILSGKVRFG